MTARPPGFTILSAAETLWASWFRDPATWAPWFTFLRVVFGLPLDDADVALFRQCTGRILPPSGPFREGWLICGRRSGKSFVLAMIAVFLAVFRDWSAYLSPGEVGVIKIVAVDRRQARVIFRYALALMTQVPSLAALVERQTDDEIILRNGITIEVQTASFRSIRGFTVVALLADEIAYWRNEESANPDSEILIAARAAMATLHGNAMLLTAGSPYARRGEQFRAFREHHGRDGSPVLVWQAETRVMNATVPQDFIDAEYARDPEAAAAEFGAQFRSDLADYADRTVIEAAVERRRFELPRVSGMTYLGTIDVSGGASDSQVAAVSYRDKGTGRAVLAALREHRAPFSPEAATAEDAALFKSYGVRRIVGDRYGGEWPVDAFRRHGITYEAADRDKSAFYHDLLPLLNSGMTELLDNVRLINQLASLERRVGRSGKDSIDHAPGAHDDVANAAAIALVLASATKGASMILSPTALRKVAATPRRNPFGSGPLGPAPGPRPGRWQRAS